MNSHIDVSQTRFQLGNSTMRGVTIRPGLRIYPHPDESDFDFDFLTPEEVEKLRDWINTHYPKGDPK